MTTNDFIKQLQEISFTVDINDVDLQLKIYHEGYLVALVSSCSQFQVDTHWDFFVDLTIEQREKLLDLAVEYAKTPIEDRVEPEKYYWKLKGVDEYNYLNLFCQRQLNMGSKVQTKDHRTQFTEKEYHKLRGRFGFDDIFVKEEIE